MTRIMAVRSAFPVHRYPQAEFTSKVGVAPAHIDAGLTYLSRAGVQVDVAPAQAADLLAAQPEQWPRRRHIARWTRSTHKTRAGGYGSMWYCGADG